ncbi:MAG TPA: hypothetical protein VI072_11025 [Polyangiaceae bacterium]
MNSNPILLLAGLGLALTQSGAARAQDTQNVSESTANSSAVPPHDWRISGVLGGFAHEDGGGVVLGVNAKVRSQWVVVGALLECGGALLADNFVGAAALAGIGPRVNEHVRLELLGAGGYHHYSAVGRDILWGNDRGASGGMPFVGGRAGASYLSGRGRNHFEIGLYGSYDHDLSRERVRYSYVDEGLFGGSGTETGEETLGWSRFGMGVELGASHDWF